VAGRLVAGKREKAPTVLRWLEASCRDARLAGGRFILGSF